MTFVLLRADKVAHNAFHRCAKNAHRTVSRVFEMVPPSPTVEQTRNRLLDNRFWGMTLREVFILAGPPITFLALPLRDHYEGVVPSKPLFLRETAQQFYCLGIDFLHLSPSGAVSADLMCRYTQTDTQLGAISFALYR